MPDEMKLREKNSSLNIQSTSNRNDRNVNVAKTQRKKVLESRQAWTVSIISRGHSVEAAADSHRHGDSAVLGTVAFRTSVRYFTKERKQTFHLQKYGGKAVTDERQVSVLDCV